MEVDKPETYTKVDSDSLEVFGIRNRVIVRIDGQQSFNSPRSIHGDAKAVSKEQGIDVEVEVDLWLVAVMSKRKLVIFLGNLAGLMVRMEEGRHGVCSDHPGISELSGDRFIVDVG